MNSLIDVWGSMGLSCIVNNLPSKNILKTELSEEAIGLAEKYIEEKVVGKSSRAAITLLSCPRNFLGLRKNSPQKCSPSRAPKLY